jgi:hypothetical protein
LLDYLGLLARPRHCLSWSALNHLVIFAIIISFIA